MEQTDLLSLYKQSYSYESLVNQLKKNKLYVNNFEQDFSYVKDLGKGANGTVKQYRQNNGDKMYAVKIFKYNQDFGDYTRAIDFITEAYTLEKVQKNINSQNVCHIKGIYANKVGQQLSLNIIQDMSDGNFEEIIDKSQQQLIKLEFQQILKIFHEQLIVLLQFQDFNITHRDIKPLNLFYKQDFNNYTSQLGDFGEASMNQNDIDTRLTSIRGTPKYISSELYYSYVILQLDYQEYNPIQSDLYSLGLTILSIAAAISDFKRIKDEKTKKELINPFQYDQMDIGNKKWFYVQELEKLFTQVRNRYKEDKVEDFINIIKYCLYYNPQLRYSISYILELMQNKFGFKHQVSINYKNVKQHKLKEIQSNSYIKQFFYSREKDQPSKNVAIQIENIPDYSNEAIRKTYTQIGNFIYDKNEDIMDYNQFIPYQYEDGSIYIGQWKNGLRQGRGKQLWNDGSFYEGYWKNNMADGKGRLIHANGDVYEGDWQNDKANGFGVYTHDDGARYEGQWSEDKQHGQGFETWPDGNKYEGQYEYGRKHGQGIYLWADGSTYQGEFKDNNIDGLGTYKWFDGRTYVGQFKNNKMDGNGEFKWPDGRKYNGQYKDDKKCGQGTFYWLDGSSYKGQWEDGKQHGKGIYINEEGIKRQGEWKEGKRIRWIEDEN